MKNRSLAGAVFVLLLGAAAVARCAEIRASAYRGWKGQAMDNGLVRLQLLPEIGGRIIQFSLGVNEFFFVHPQLAGTLPPPSRLGPGGSWLNYGGDKLWPAPQGRGGPEFWPGPPDVVLDAGPYELKVGEASGPAVSVSFTSEKDPRSGIQFSRTVRLENGSTHVSFEASMKNIDTKPRRWGIWSHTQLNGGKPGDREFNPLMKAWCPINPKSHFPNGLNFMAGAKDNPSFRPNFLPGLLRVEYQYRVGKIGMDSAAGWVASVNGATGAAFIQRFVFEPGQEYPDGASVEFWNNGIGRTGSPGKEKQHKNDPDENPFVFESEMLSPFARVNPGETYSWRYDWYAANIGGDYPVVGCSDAGVVAESFMAVETGGKIRLKGRFGVFYPGSVTAVFTDGSGRKFRPSTVDAQATPLKPVVVDVSVDPVAGAKSVTLILTNSQGKVVGELAKAEIQSK